MTMDDKIRVFLTDQSRSRAGSNKVSEMSKQVMVSISPFYKRPETADGFRKEYGMTKKHTWGIDSGGFQFLMGKLDGVPLETLPCGVKVPTSAQHTIDIYKRTGLQQRDLPIQLDLPPRYDLPPEHRKQLIDRSVLYYYEMVPEIPEVVPVIHGWTKEEMEYNLELITDPDKAQVALGSYAATTRGSWTMGKLNPHKPRLGVGSMKAFHNSENYIGFTDNVANKDRDQLAIGSYKVLTHNNYYKDHVRQGAIAIGVPGRLDLGIDIPFVDKVNSRVAVAAPSKVDVGMQDPSNTPMVAAPSRKRIALGSFVASAVGADGGAAINPQAKRKRQRLAVGSFAASSTGPLGEKLGEKKKSTTPRVSFNVIMDRIAMSMNLLRDDYDIFMLGGASPHMIHQVFLAGASWTDTSAWRIKGLMGEIYLWDHSSGKNSFHIGYSDSDKKTKMDSEASEILREYLQDVTHPFSGMSVKRFLQIGYMNVRGHNGWRETWEKNQWEVKPGPLRMLHNAWVLKRVIEPIAHDYASAPDKYYEYLKKCLEPRPTLSKRLKQLWDRLQHPYVQTDLGVYLK